MGARSPEGEGRGNFWGLLAPLNSIGFLFWTCDPATFAKTNLVLYTLCYFLYSFNDRVPVYICFLCRNLAITVVSQKSHSWLAVYRTSTYINRFLAYYWKSRKSKHALFSTLPSQCFCTTWRKRKTKNCTVFSPKRCMLLCQQTHKTHSSYQLGSVAAPSFHKRLTLPNRT